MNTYLIRSLAKCKENRIPLKNDAKQTIQESFNELKQSLNITGIKIIEPEAIVA